MAATLKIDQVGLSAGVNGKARLDGKADGSVVTLTSVSPGATNTFRLLSVPPEDDEAIDSLAPTGGGATPVWTFTPKVGVHGAYRVELVVDAGLTTESRQVRIFGIPTGRHRLVAPALNEVGDPEAHAEMSGTALATALARTERNVTRDGQPSVAGWQLALQEMADAVEVGNHSVVVVPDGAVCKVPAGQQMLYVGDLEGDFDTEGDLIQLDEEGGDGGEAAHVPKPWSDVITADATLVANVLSRYDGNNIMMLTFPDLPAVGDEVELKNVGGVGATETVTLAGAIGTPLENFDVSEQEVINVTNPGFWARWKYDGVVWRLVGPPYFAEVG